MILKCGNKGNRIWSDSEASCEMTLQLVEQQVEDEKQKENIQNYSNLSSRDSSGRSPTI